MQLTTHQDHIKELICWRVTTCEHAACAVLLQAMKIASVRAADHWQPQGEVQLGLRGARARASAAASSGQAARGKAQALASRLDAAALLVEQGNKAAAGMTLVG